MEKKNIANKQEGIIAIFEKDFVYALPISPLCSLQHIETWRNKQIVDNEEKINFLLSINAPIGLWRNVNRKPKS